MKKLLFILSLILTITVNAQDSLITNHGVKYLGTTVGKNFLGLTNPSAIRFPQINADNSVSALSASAFLAAIGGGGSTISGIGNYNDSIANVLNYGATGNGTTEDSTAFQTAIATGKNVYVPKGTYKMSGTLYLKKGQTIFGDGAASILKTTTVGSDANYFVMYHMMVLADSNITVRDLSFEGTGMATVVPTYTTQNAINVYGGDCKVLNCKFSYLRGFAVLRMHYDGSSFTAHTRFGLLMSGCHVSYSGGGYYAYQAGYDEVTGNRFAKNDIAILGDGSNGYFASNSCDSNNYGVRTTLGDRCTFTNCTFNHNATYALDINNTTNGMLFTGCTLFFTPLNFLNADRTILSNCAIATNSTITVNGFTTTQTVSFLGGFSTSNSFVTAGTGKIIRAGLQDAGANKYQVYSDTLQTNNLLHVNNASGLGMLIEGAAVLGKIKSNSGDVGFQLDRAGTTAGLQLDGSGNLNITGASSTGLGLNGMTEQIILKPYYDGTNFHMKMGFNNSSPAGIIDVVSTTKGVLFPRMTTTQRLAVSPSEGEELYDLTLHKKYFYDGTAWQASGGTYFNSNVGSAYRLAKPGTNDIKTLDVDTEYNLWDSGTTNQIKLLDNRVKASSELGTTTTTNVLSYTTPNDGIGRIYDLGNEVGINSVSVGTVTTTVTYTDRAGTSRTVTLYNSGSTTAAIGIVSISSYPVLQISTSPNTTITVTVTVTGTINYSSTSTLTLIRQIGV